MINCLLLGLFIKGYVFFEGFFGLVKMLVIKMFLQVFYGQFSCIQFMLDLLFVDIVGIMIFNLSKNDFLVCKGFVFVNFILVDEINCVLVKV